MHRLASSRTFRSYSGIVLSFRTKFSRSRVGATRLTAPRRNGVKSVECHVATLSFMSFWTFMRVLVKLYGLV